MQHFHFKEAVSRCSRKIQGKRIKISCTFIKTLTDVKKFARAVRGHWGIENCLHWMLDVSFNEDKCRIRKDNAAENLAVIRHIALNLLNKENSAKRSIKTKMKCCGWSNEYLIKVLLEL